jgi:outer membrane biosynthesis protein TonB
MPLSYSRYAPHARDDVVSIPRFWITLVASLLVHLAAIWLWFPRTPLLTAGADEHDDASRPLSLRLVETPRVPSAPSPPAPKEAPPPPVARRPQPPTVALRRAPRPPVMAIETPAPVKTPPPPPPPPPPTPQPPSPPMVAVPSPAPPQLEGDLASYIAARRRARGEAGESATPEEAETARRDRIVAANLAGLQSSTTFGNAPRNGGGTFQIQRMDFQDAEFSFFGWSQDIKRRTYQRIEVKKGDNPDINTAIIRRIIAIIREHETADFRWQSKRLGRDLMLSARPADNAELEAFMMQEFFTSSHQPR